MERTRRRALKSVGALAAGLSIAGCLGNDGGDGNGNGDGNGTTGGDPGTETGTPGDGAPDLRGSVGPTPDHLKLTEYSTFTSGDDVGVDGAVRNVGDQPLEDVEVEVTLRDGDTVIGELVDTNEQETETLRPEESWQFEVVFEDETRSEATGFTVSADATVAQEAEA